MKLTIAITLAFLSEHALALQANAVNIRQHEESRDSQICQMFASTSATANAICSVLSEQSAAEDFDAYRVLLADKVALDDFRRFTELRSSSVLREHLHKILLDPKLLEHFLQFQQFQEWQAAQAPVKPFSPGAIKVVPAQANMQLSSNMELKQKHDASDSETLSDSAYLVLIPAVLLVIFCSVVGPGSACGSLVNVFFAGMQALYMLIFGPDSLDDDKPPKKEPDPETLKDNGIAKPVNTLWYTEWDDLTPGQKWVFSYIGVTDQKMWDLARKRDDISKEEMEIRDTQLHLDWGKLSRRQKGKLGYLGFTEASFNEDSTQPLGIHEKRWEHLSKMEKKQAAKLLENVDVKAAHCDEWDHRTAPIFRTSFHLLPKEQRQEVVKLGFGRRHWKQYVDPEPPAPDERSNCEYCMATAGKALAACIGLFFVYWVCFCLHETGVMHNIFANFGTYIFGAILASAVVAVVVYEIWELAQYIVEAFIHQANLILTHVTDLWDKVDESIERVDSAARKLDVKSKAKEAVHGCMPHRASSSPVS